MIGILAVIAFAVTALAGCGSAAPDSLVGTVWTVESLSDGTMTLSAEEYAKELGAEGEMRLQFHENTVDVMTGDHVDDTVEYSYERGRVIMGEQKGSIEGDRMKFRIGNTTMVLKRR